MSKKKILFAVAVVAIWLIMSWGMSKEMVPVSCNWAGDKAIQYRCVSLPRALMVTGLLLGLALGLNMVAVKKMQSPK